MNLGVFGGTFDPVHNGHLRVAQEARARFNLAEIIFVPAGHPWMKVRVITPTEHRIKMLRLAIAGKPYFRISAVEIERAGPTYTVDTIEQLRGEINPEDEVFFILGWDSLARLPEWQDSPRLVRLCRLIVAPRPGYAVPYLNTIEASIPGITGRILIMDKPIVDIGATEIRERVARGQSIRHLVPRAVSRYIQQQHLYVASE